jgi:hypothetical protein
MLFSNPKSPLQMSVSSAFTSTLRATSSVFVPRAAGVRLLLILFFLLSRNSPSVPHAIFRIVVFLSLRTLIRLSHRQSKGSDMLLSHTPNGSIYGTTPGGTLWRFAVVKSFAHACNFQSALCVHASWVVQLFLLLHVPSV